MTARFKDFGAGDGEELEPLSFKLYGEEFECYPAIQGKFLLNLIGSSASDDVLESSKVVTDFFAKVLKPESAIRFNALLEDPEKIVSVETLAEITTWLMEEYTDRPNQQPEASSTGQ